MHIIVTLAGHSRRFKAAGYHVPKFLAEIEGKLMIEHVLDMFDPSDTFHFVINEDQVATFPNLMQILSTLVKRSSVKIIPSHELGPVFSSLQVDQIPEDQEVVITYCDFIVEWDYKKFKREVSGYSAGIPAFKGFHPASFGETKYAYMRVDENLSMLELREKESFTIHREQEYASAGIYYFSQWRLYEYYAKRLMTEGFQGLNEGYVSLIANLLVGDGLSVKVTEVKRFICWGTPEDLAQYLFWSNYFLKNLAIKKYKTIARDGARRVNLIPMAGKGSRFRDAMFKTSKPLISIGSLPMVVSACQSFPEADTWIFLPRADDLSRHSLKDALRSCLSESIEFVPVDHETTGQAATCLLAKKLLNSDDHLLITSCDYRTIYDNDDWQKIVDDDSIDAVIWTTRIGAGLIKNPSAFAYCVTEVDGFTVNKIVEKHTISEEPGNDPLVVGTFWFRRSGDFIRVAEAAISKNLNVNGEHYVANSMNLLLAEGKRIIIFDIIQWISFGDPFELDIYYYWEDYFYSKVKNNLSHH